MKLTSGVTIFGAAIFLPVLTLGLLSPIQITGQFVSPGLHAFFEITSTLIGVLFGLLAVQGFYATGSRRLLLLGFGLSSAGMLFLLHSLALSKLFSSLTSLEQHIWFGNLAMLILAIFLFLGSAFNEHLVVPWARSPVVFVTCLFFLAVLYGSVFATGYGIANGLSISSTVGRWTPLGQYFHMAIITLLTLASLRLLHGAFTIRSQISMMFATGVVLLLMSDITASASVQTFDIFYWMSHVWRLLGFLSFFFGLFVGHRHIHIKEQIRLPRPTK